MHFLQVMMKVIIQFFFFSVPPLDCFRPTGFAEEYVISRKLKPSNGELEGYCINSMKTNGIFQHTLRF